MKKKSVGKLKTIQLMWVNTLILWFAKQRKRLCKHLPWCLPYLLKRNLVERCLKQCQLSWINICSISNKPQLFVGHCGMFYSNGLKYFNLQPQWTSISKTVSSTMIRVGSGPPSCPPWPLASCSLPHIDKARLDRIGPASCQGLSPAIQSYRENEESHTL